MTEFTAEQRESLKQIGKRSRMIVTAKYAQELMDPFFLDVYEMEVVYNTSEEEKGIDWGSHTERWGSGAQVNICTLAWKLADILEAPEIKYTIDVSGAGRRSEMSTHKSLIRLDLLQGIAHRSCAACREYDMDGRGNDPRHMYPHLCSKCEQDRVDYESHAIVMYRHYVPGSMINDEPIESRFPDLIEYSVKKGQYHKFPPYKMGVCKEYTLEQALATAYAWNAADGVIGPVNLVRDTTWDYLFEYANLEVPS